LKPIFYSLSSNKSGQTLCQKTPGLAVVSMAICMGLLIPLYVKGQFQNVIKNDKRLRDIENYLIFNIDSAYSLASKIHHTLKKDQVRLNTYITATLALTHQLKGNSKEAVVLLEKAKSILTDDKYLTAYTLYVDALISMEIGDETQSLEAILTAIEIFESLREHEKTASCYTVLCKLYFNLGDARAAVSTLNKAIRIHTFNHNNPRLAGDYHNLAILISGNNPDSGLVLLDQAIALNRQYGNQLWLANNYGLQSSIFRRKGLMDTAHTLMRQAEQIYKELNFQAFRLDAMMTIGHLYFFEKKYDEAMATYDSVMAATDDQGGMPNLIEVYRNISEIHFERGNFSKSRAYNQLYILLKDSLQKVKNDNRLSILEIRNKYKNQREELRLENERVILASRKKNWIITGMVFLIFIVGFLLYTLYKWKKYNEQRDQRDLQLMQKEIELQNKELTLAVMSKVKQSKTLELFKEKLKDVESSVPPKNRSEIHNLMHEISRDKGSLLWKEFEMRFTKINDDFYAQLKHLAQDLTPAEIKICSFLRMGLNTKEIADLLCKSPASIEVDRARIRKKLGLSHAKTNLSTFLKDL